MTPVATTSGLERFSLSGRIALVTGATRGLGLEIARGMAAAGAVVGINGRDAARAREVAKGIPNAFAASFDITDLCAAESAIFSGRGQRCRSVPLARSHTWRNSRSVVTSERLSDARAR